jgi:hypothetical protein
METSGKNRKFIIASILAGAVALAILFLPILNPPKARSNRLTCASHLKQISLALGMYASDWGGAFPPNSHANGLEILRSQGYLEDPKMYVCPSSDTIPAAAGEKLTEEHVDYHYRGGLSETALPGTALAWDKDRNHTKFGNILFLDVYPHISGFTGKNWQDNIRQRQAHE